MREFYTVCTHLEVRVLSSMHTPRGKKSMHLGDNAWQELQAQKHELHYLLKAIFH
jgi:hypothetical protein